MKPLLKSMKSIAIALFVICNLTMLISQPLTWQRAFRSLNNDDEGYSICNADENNFYVTGLTSDPRDGLIIKINQHGDSVWKRHTNSTEFIFASTGLSDGSIVVAGNFGSIQRIDANSNLLWNIENHTSIFYDFIQSNGSLFAAGYYDLYPNRGPTVLKMQFAGDTLWQKVYSGFGIGGFNSSLETADGNLILGGSLGSSISKCFLMKCDTAGNVMWTKQYDLSLTCGIRDIELTGNGYLLSCYSLGGTDTSSIILLKTNQNGDSLCIVRRKSFQYCLSAPLLKANNINTILPIQNTHLRQINRLLLLELWIQV